MSRRLWAWTTLLLVLLMYAVSSMVRPLLPVAETRFLTVVWEMWQSGDWLAPQLNGAPYANQPPLASWLVYAGWWAAGVSDTWPRLIGPLSALVSAVALERLGARLWPKQASAGRLGSLMWTSTFYAALTMTGVTSEMVSLALISCGWLLLYRAVQDGSTSPWLGWGVASGLAILASGPVALLYVVPPILALPLWSPQLRPRASRLGPPVGAFVFVAIPLCWIYAASQRQGLHIGAFVRDWVAVAPPGPMGASRFAYWYVPLLAGMLLPWSLWPPFWRAAGGWKLLWRERSSRLLVVVVVVPLVALSAARGNQPPQLIPIIASAMLLAGRLLAERDVRVSGWAPIFPALLIGGSGIVVHMLIVAGGAHIPAWISEPPWWVSAFGFLIAMTLVSKGARAAEPAVHRTAVAAVAFAALIVAGGSEVLGPRYDLDAAARYIHSMQRSGHPIAYVGPYEGEFGYLGRLEGPVTPISKDESSTWLRTHPDGLLIVRDRSALNDRQNVLVYRQPYKGDALLMYRSAGAAAQSISED